ncbi:MAG: hypothetical protein H0T46_04455 [Deltaproteobacteria bacterium]|nr:hypothetical protein [Deltaproteobacteria bacterium]
MSWIHTNVVNTSIAIANGQVARANVGQRIPAAASTSPNASSGPLIDKKATKNAGSIASESLSAKNNTASVTRAPSSINTRTRASA